MRNNEETDLPYPFKLFVCFNSSQSWIIIISGLMCILLSGCSDRYRYTSPVDRSDIPLRIKHVTGNVYTVEDYNYWQSNSLLYVHDDGILFFGSTWNSSIASSLIWKASTMGYGDFLAVIPMSHHLHQSGGIREFSNQDITVEMHERTARLLEQNWESMNNRMQNSFFTWRTTTIPEYETFRGDRRFLDDRVIVFHPGRAFSPDNIAVLFREERILYAGSILSADPHFQASDKDNIGDVLAYLESLPADLYIAGHGRPVYGKEIIALSREAYLK